jgi:proteasome component ECM29
MAFLSLLSNPQSKQLARESCCLGLSACHGFSLAVSTQSSINGNDETRKLNERLLRAFGQTTKHSGSSMMESREQHSQRMRENNTPNQGTAATMMEDFGVEAEVGGTAGMGEAALGAYKEMANAAIMLDRPDILYSLMLLSVSLPIWSVSSFRDHYSASSLLGVEEGNTEKTDEIKKALRPYLKNLIPRLLRACNDPNKQTREQMEALWIGLTGGGAEARTLVNSHLLSTIDSLMDDATNKLWRARVGACSALAEVIVGRTWYDLGNGGVLALDDYSNRGPKTAASRLLQLYKVTVRSLDDVRLTVRESGETLSRSVRSLTIRLCDSSATNNNDTPIYTNEVDRTSSVAAAATILPWLVKHGLNSPCQEATGFAVSCLLGIVEVAKPKTLEPVLPELIGSLLMAMSGLEPAALNYLQTRAAGQNSNRFEQLERIRLQMAQSGPISGALTKCLEMVKCINSDAQKSAVIPQIDSALRCGAGFATRAAAADAVSTLCSQCPSSFKFTGTSTSNPTVRLLRALYFASEREQGAGARDKMTHAFGNLAALAPGTSVRSLALRLCERYTLATGSNDGMSMYKILNKSFFPHLSYHS